MKKIFSLIITFSLFSCVLSADIERRAAIDIGSGGTKVAIADVDTETQQIIEVLLDSSFSVPYQASLDKSDDGTFDEETQKQGLKVFKEIKDLAEHYQVKKIAAIATSAFRKSNNTKSFIEKVWREAQIKIQVIPQREEGEIAFFSSLATGQFEPEQAVVWDIGTGSLQMTTLNSNQELTVYMGEQMGSVAFKSYIIDVIQNHNVEHTSSPNPISEEQLKMADSYARAFARKAYPLIKEKIRQQEAVVGIGRLFYNSIRPIAADQNGVVTRKGLRTFINNSLNKTDTELNNPFAHVDVSNCILVLAIMKALHIQAIIPIDTTTTRGMLIYESYWETAN